jgi:ATP-binding cassette subfamily C protein
VAPHRLALAAGTGLSLLAGVTGLALPLVVKRLVDDLGHHRAITGVLLVMTAVVLLNAGIGAFGNYVLRRTAETVVLAARGRLVDRLLGLTVGALDRSEPGDLISRVTSDTTLLRQITDEMLAGAITGTVVLAVALVLMGLLDVVLLGITLAVFGVAALVLGVVVPRIGRAARRAQDSVGMMGAELERLLGAFRTVKASGAERREGGRIHLAARRAWREDVHAARWQAIAASSAGMSIQLAFLAVLAAGGARVATGAISVATLIAFLLYVYYLMPAVQQVASAVSQYQVAGAAVGRIEEAARLPVEAAERTGEDAAGPRLTAAGPELTAAAPGLDAAGPELTATAPGLTAAGPGLDAAAPWLSAAGPAAVTFERVRFRYRPELPEVHADVSFTIPPRGMTAFVGPSGAGKTTVFSLIERFYEPGQGRVMLDGTDVRDWPLPLLRGAIGYVEQDAPVLSGTLRENMLLGAPDASADGLHEVLRVTRLDDLVARLPDGLETAVGHRGARLSGGERQRVAVARALLRGPRLLLLDEATSQLDALNEAALRDAIAAAARVTTVLVVAHRLSTVVMADRIIVMDGGRVRAVGTHAELVAASPLYAELAATQFLAAPGP